MIEVILAAGMLGGLALGAASLMDNMNSGQNSGRFGIARLELRSNVVSFLANNLRSCSCSLKDKTFNPGTLPATIPLPDGLQIFATPATCSDPLRAVAKKELKIENAEVKSVDLILKSGTGSMYTGELHVMMVASNMNKMERKVIIPKRLNVIPNCLEMSGVMKV